MSLWELVLKINLPEYPVFQTPQNICQFNQKVQEPQENLRKEKESFLAALSLIFSILKKLHR